MTPALVHETGSHKQLSQVLIYKAMLIYKTMLIEFQINPSIVPFTIELTGFNIDRIIK